jgi:hypothetical protein
MPRAIPPHPISAVALAVLLGGCIGRDETKKTLLARNAQLESQLSASQHIITALAITSVLLGCGLAVTLYRRRIQGEPRDPGPFQT